MEATAEESEGGGFTITHMLHSIIPSFVRRTMRARGTGFKKDRHTVTASNPGETPAIPEVSQNKLGLTLNLFLLYSREITSFFEVFKSKSTTRRWFLENKQGNKDKRREDWR